MVGIKELARAAGVSVGTVSNVLNHPTSVSVRRRERVERAIEELGFVRNESARQLRAGFSRTIALVVLDVANPFFTDVVAGAEDAAADVGSLVVICNSAGDPVRERRHLVRLEEQRVMGLLLTPVLDEVDTVAGGLQRRGTPVVLLDRVSRDAELSCVAVDDVRGGQLAGEHLLAQGHRAVTFIGGPLGLRQVDDRLAGARAAGGGALRVNVLETPTMSVRAGAQAGARLYAESPADRPTAVFCGNDLLALGVLNECVRRAIRVPHELALVGYDDIGFAATATVPLTSVRQPREQLGRTAVELLLERTALHGEPAPPRSVVFEPDLVVRDSSRLPMRSQM